MVVVTRDRRSDLEATLARLAADQPAAPVVVVDNASGDGTAAAARRRDGVSVVALPANLGAGGRTIGARLARTPWIAFCDDDSWWAPGSLERAAALLSADPGLGLVAARVVVEPAGVTDPLSGRMAAGALDPDLRARSEGPRGVTGFLACAVVVRRTAFLAVGGFDPRFVVGGEEELVAIDLAGQGWRLRYAPEVVAHHAPSPRRDPPARRRRQAANHVITGILRAPPAELGRRAGALVASAGRDAAARGALGDVLVAASWALARRRRVPPAVEVAFFGVGRPATG
ncbi:MAG TPA: glycosyltransferase [Acidimicrobiales bacterium]|nr:glycosyltransferase [Acidimicrobiales bacterium]